MIEYHPSFRFGGKLKLFPQELRNRLDKQRQEYKKRRGNSNNNNNNNSGPSKRQIKKARAEVRLLAELVDLTQGQASNSRTANANTMGGRNERQQQCQQSNNNNNDEIAAKNVELKDALNISKTIIKIQ